MRKSSRRATARDLTPFLTGVVVMLVVILAASGVATQALSRNTESDLSRANTLISTRHDIDAAVATMQTSLQRNVIGVDRSSLALYEDSAQRLPSLWSTLVARDSGTPLMPLVEQMQAGVEGWQRDLARPAIALVDAGRKQDAMALIVAHRGDAPMAEFLRAGASFNDAIDTDISSYSSRLDYLDRAGEALLAVLGLLAAGCAILTVRMARREAHARDEAAGEAEAEIARLETIVEKLPVAVRLVSAPDARVMLQNDAAARLMDVDLWNRLDPEKRGAQLGLLGPHDVPITADDQPAMRALRQGETVVDFEVKSAPAGGPVRFLLVSAAPLRDRQGQITSAVVVIQDITGIRELEERKDEFIAIAAHELRNPLTALKGHFQLVQRAMNLITAPPDVMRHLREIGIQADRLHALVDYLLDASRIQLGRLALDRNTFDLADAVHMVVSAAQASEEQDHKIVFVPPHSQLIGEWDALRIQQVLTNLMSNAVRYSPPNSRVEVRLAREDGSALVEVVDEGPGIPREDRAGIFSRYYQTGSLGSGNLEGGARPPRHQGLGLGLYICNEIVKAHGGQIGVEANPEGGSIFWFRLPLAARD